MLTSGSGVLDKGEEIPGKCDATPCGFPKIPPSFSQLKTENKDYREALAKLEKGC